MEKEVSHDKKLEFYKKYNSKSFQDKMNKIYDKFRKIFLSSFFIGIPITLVLGLINPWLFFSVIPALAVPLTTTAIESAKIRKLVLELDGDITHNDVLVMIESGEWTMLGYELNAKGKNVQHYAKGSELVVEEKAINKPKSSNQCITKENNKQNLHNKTNLVKKTEKRHTKQKIENIPRSLNCCIIKNEEIKLTYSLLSKFAESIDCSLVEFIPSCDYEENKTHIVKLKNNNKIISFEVSGNHFVGLCQYSDTDLTTEWCEYLEKLNEKSTNL